MKRITYLLSTVCAFSFILSVSSCSYNSPANPTTESTVYFQSYRVIFDKTAKTTEATAQFRVNTKDGIIMALSDNESLNINENLATMNADKTYKWSDIKLTNVLFVFTKNKGKQFPNAITIGDTSDINFPTVFPSSINKSSGATIVWDGKPVTGNETILLTLNDGTHPPVYKYYDNGNFYITSTDIMNLTPGMITISLDRIKPMDLQSADPGAGGERIVVVRTSMQISLN